MITKLMDTDKIPYFILQTVFVVFLSAFLSIGVSAQEAQQSSIIGASSALNLEAGTGRVIRLERPVSAVFVADPETADVQAHSPTLIYVFARQNGATTIFAVDGNEQILFQREVIVTHPLGRLRNAIQSAAPLSNVKVNSIDNAVILTGQVDSPSVAEDILAVTQTYLAEDEQIVNRMEIQSSTQVNIRVRVAEIDRNISKQLGFNIDGEFSVGDAIFNFVTGRTFLDRATNTFSRGGDSGTAAGFLGGYSGNDLTVDGMLDVLETEGLAATLAEPNLTALSGETATFLAGGEIPIPIDNGDGGISISFREFGVSLAFTPTVLSANRISLKVQPQVSSLDEANGVILASTTIPALRTRRAETTIELGSGQSFAIGGLISSETSSTLSKVPGLSSLPIIGPLFRSSTFDRSESELVIIVTPYLVKPARLSDLKTPVDNFQAASDLDRIIHGRLVDTSLPSGAGAPRITNTGTLLGPAGFMIR